MLLCNENSAVNIAASAGRRLTVTARVLDAPVRVAVREHFIAPAKGVQGACGCCPQYLVRKFPMNVIRLPSGSVIAERRTFLFAVSIGPGAKPLDERSATCLSRSFT